MFIQKYEINSFNIQNIIEIQQLLKMINLCNSVCILKKKRIKNNLLYLC